MAYCTVEDVIKMLKADMINCIIGNDYIEDEEERIKKITPITKEAIEDADAEIDGYLAKRYSVPFTKVPKTLNKFSKDIAIYNLMSRKGIDESDREKTYLNRYNAAIRFLENVAKGIIDIGVDENSTKNAAQTGFSIKSSDRLFSRDTMKGW